MEAEQKYVTGLYDRLDGMRALAETRLQGSLATTGGTPQARSQRESSVAMYTDQLAQLSAVESGLCFGRLDPESGAPLYIGRIGIFDEEGDYEPLLLDWRAPASRPFYLATAADPLGIRRRRHIRSKGRTVVALDDEVLDLAEAAGSATRDGLAGEAALLAAVDARRTGRMRDIVETIQAEQDRIIRADLSGVLVVQGGPGTGKTAVALHRAAYLLYTHRRELSTRAVLVVGPNPTFLRYISHVLPSLAETGVLLWTLGDLFPGVTARGEEPERVAEIKGRAAMVDVLAAAIADRQELPTEPTSVTWDGEELTIDRQLVETARARARRSGRLHNPAREVFRDALVEGLVQQAAAIIGTDPYADDPLGAGDAPGDPMLMGAADLADIRAELTGEPGVRAALDRYWPPLTPQRLLRDLFSSADRLAAACAESLTLAEAAALTRPATAPWTPADAPLLDEAAEQLGELPEAETAARIQAERVRRSELAYAEGALEIARGSASIDVEDEDDPELLLVTDLLDASRLAERQEDDLRLSAAERAARDRKWAFGHIIVDEAQELSPMAWRLLMRRAPNRSMTVVGDIAQTGDPAGAASWSEVFAPYVADRWKLAELTVNYRTPAEVMSLAGEVLARIDPAATPPRSVRSTGVAPARRPLADLPAVLGDEAAVIGEGRLAVIAPAGRVAALAEQVRAALPDLAVAVGDEPDLESPVAVLSARQSKGLEFDSVVVADPAGIENESPRGLNDLYVALTRATQRLTVLE
ncbi:AAA family ATPase [Asanoa sp. WMMD1127]|uniref:HelD family protein n=1 Tax=Asanoa sp. WMMD1127 TaxID=3016107 RepID=UPI002415A15F|nr:ATP-binding domain-containing protein [Asanoa sp. WMMD1127]MDG4824229.1 AAA family ATPase [Asanoa sp. WMMD1127]